MELLTLFWIILVLGVVALIELGTVIFSRLVNACGDCDEEVESPFRFPGTRSLFGSIFSRVRLIFDPDHEYGSVENGIFASILFIVLFSPVDSVFLSFVLLGLLFLAVTYRYGIARSVVTFGFTVLWFACLCVAPEE